MTTISTRRDMSWPQVREQLTLLGYTDDQIRDASLACPGPGMEHAMPGGMYRAGTDSLGFWWLAAVPAVPASAAGESEAGWLRDIRDIAGEVAVTDAEAGARIRALLFPQHVHEDDGTAEGCPGCFPPGEAIGPVRPAGIRDEFHAAMNAHADRRPDVHDHEEHRDGAVAGCPACVTGPAMDREDTRNALRALGYPEGAIRQAIEHAPWTEAGDGPSFLRGHTVILRDGSYRILRVPDPTAGAGGHELLRQLIAKHGTDRFPTAPAAYRHAADELGELGEALMDWYLTRTDDDPAGTDGTWAHVRKELGDAGLCVYGLALKLGLDLDEVMADVVRGETRTFTSGEDHARACPNC